ncbi:MAG: SDR family oxidoreductase [Lachnospiraceae bacterium]|nr:SDR family oxidoreductase [Lachnospiraceae bacterium]
MDLGLRDKKVIITASSNGIGKATALAFANEGAKVLINGRNPQKLSAVKNEISTCYGEDSVLSVCGDATTDETRDKIIREAHDKWGSIDILIPCVGSGKSESENPLSLDEWNRLLNINLLCNVGLIDKCISLLQKGNDPVITMISSVVAISRASAPASYAAAKSGILTLNNYLAAEYKNTGIRVNCVVPGNVYFTGGRWEEIRNADVKGTDEYINSNVPMNRFGKPEEIADAIVFMSSKRASFINGAVLTVDGGQNGGIK